MKRAEEAVIKEDPTSHLREDRYQQFLNQKRELQSRSLTSGIRIKGMKKLNRGFFQCCDTGFFGCQKYKKIFFSYQVVLPQSN
jgi:hypothetical protein